MSRLRVEGLAKRYRSRQIVKDLSIEVSSGEVVGLLGPNGAGKTTAFYMIVGLVPCDKGRISLDERVVVNPDGKNQGRVNITVRPKPGETLNDRSGSANPPTPESGT